MGLQVTNNITTKAALALSLAASAAGVQSGVRGDEAMPVRVSSTPVTGRATRDDQLILPPFRPVAVSAEVGERLKGDAELKTLLSAAEPLLRGQRVVFAVVDRNGKVVDGRELQVPVEQKENSKLLWGIFAAGLAASATLSGLTIGLFSISKLQLTILSEQGNEDARKVLGLREDANTVLSTLIWGNVGLNVLISRVGDQAVSTQLGAVGAALFSIGAITLFGEILPQAYFTQHPLQAGARLEPVVKALRFLLYPVAKPSGFVMDKLVGQEGVQFFQEKELEQLLKLSSQHNGAETSHVEATGAINFLQLDDVPAGCEGELISEKSILNFPLKDGTLQIPASTDRKFLTTIDASGEKWVVFCDQNGNPHKLLDADAFLRAAMFQSESVPIDRYWHEPIVVTDNQLALGAVIPKLSVTPEHPLDNVIDMDVILVWTPQEKRIITIADLFGRLAVGIAAVNDGPTSKEAVER